MRFFAAVLVASSALVSAFDEAGIIQLSSFDNATSTGKHCVPKGFDPAAPIPDRYFALLRTGETAVVSSYVGTSNGTALTAAVNDKGQNITLTRGADDTVHVSVAQEDGVCNYVTKVVAGSVLSINSTTPITEAGILTISDHLNTTSLAVCEATAQDINATYAFVKTADLTVMGGLWAKGATPLKRKAKDDVSYQLAAADGKVSIHTDGGKNTTVRDVGGCGFETKVVGGSVMGVVAADSSASIPSNLRGNKVICRQTCSRNVCRTVCRDYWR